MIELLQNKAVFQGDGKGYRDLMLRVASSRNPQCANLAFSLTPLLPLSSPSISSTHVSANLTAVSSKLLAQTLFPSETCWKFMSAGPSMTRLHHDISGLITTFSKTAFV